MSDICRKGREDWLIWKHMRLVRSVAGILTGLPVLLMASDFGIAAQPSGAQTARAGDMTVRNAHGMAFDRLRGVTVLFGGADAERVRGNTGNGTERVGKRVSERGPSARTFPAMTFDSARGVTLLFGGNRVLFGAQPSDAKFLDDFWQWDGKQWEQLPSGPGPRAEAAFTFR